MSQISNKANKFEFINDSQHVLFQNNLYHKHNGNSWKCKEKGCTSTLNIDEKNLIVTRQPTQHTDHPEVILTLEQFTFKTITVEEIEEKFKVISSTASDWPLEFEPIIFQKCASSLAKVYTVHFSIAAFRS